MVYFKSMHDTVHIDEKWFYLTQIKKTLYLALDEEPPERNCKSKRFITKVKFMAATARPQWDPQKKRWFDGKIGTWPFVYKEAAKRNSKNRPKGTLETKAITSVTKEHVAEMMTSKIFPAIREKMPLCMKSRPIYVQQDNAKPRSSTTDGVIVAEGQKDGWNISLVCQPPSSPDMNVLDLGFFNSIQSLQHRTSPRNIDELIQAVGDAYAAKSRETIDTVFLSLQMAMESTMLHNGSNNFKFQHMSKEKLRREGRLPVSISCKPDAVSQARNVLGHQVLNSTSTFYDFRSMYHLFPTKKKSGM